MMRLATLSLLICCVLLNAQGEEMSTPSIGQRPYSIYSPYGKRDPFKLLQSKDRGGADRQLSNINPNDRFSVDQLRLKAILKSDELQKALFQNPLGQTFIVTEGDVIGREKAVVSRILNSEVIVTQRSVNYLGAESLVERVMSLPDDEFTPQAEVTENRSTSSVTSTSKKEDDVDLSVSKYLPEDLEKDASQSSDSGAAPSPTLASPSSSADSSLRSPPSVSSAGSDASSDSQKSYGVQAAERIVQ